MRDRTPPAARQPGLSAFFQIQPAEAQHETFQLYLEGEVQLGLPAPFAWPCNSTPPGQLIFNIRGDRFTFPPGTLVSDWADAQDMAFESEIRHELLNPQVLALHLAGQSLALATFDIRGSSRPNAAIFLISTEGGSAMLNTPMRATPAQATTLGAVPVSEASDGSMFTIICSSTANKTTAHAINLTLATESCRFGSSPESIQADLRTWVIIAPTSDRAMIRTTGNSLNAQKGE